MRLISNLFLLLFVAFLCGSCKKELKEGYVYCSKCGGDGWDGGICKLCRGNGQLKVNSVSMPSFFPSTSNGSDNNSSSSYTEEYVDDDFPEIEIDEPTGHFEYVKKQVPCHVCGGEGFTISKLNGSSRLRCGFCHGKGYETITEQEWVE